MNEMNEQKREYRKFEMERLYHLEFLFDNPYPHEKMNAQGFMMKSYKFTFKDLDRGDEFFCFVSRESKDPKTGEIMPTKVSEKLRSYGKGDQIDLTIQSFESNGKVMKSYKIYPLGQTPIKFGQSAITPQQMAQTPAPFKFVPKPQEEPNSAIDINEIDW